MKPRTKALGSSNIIGERVQQLRQLHKMKQKELMNRMQLYGENINYTSLSKLEGQIRMVSDKEIMVLSQIFEITPNELLNYNLVKKPKYR